MGNIYCCGQSPMVNKKMEIIKSKRYKTWDKGQQNQISNKIYQTNLMQDFRLTIKLLQNNCNTKVEYPKCFRVLFSQRIGKGAQSQVYRIKADYQFEQQQMALKIIHKNSLQTNSIRKSIAMQNLILLYNSCPFLIKSNLSLEDETNIYYFSPVAKGGDLVSLREQYSGKNDYFIQNAETNIKFIVAGIILGLQYIHGLGIIYNDLKLQNILIDEQGFPLINDLSLIQPDTIGIAQYRSSYFEQIVGTVCYLSPQKKSQFKYNRSVDLWALGILIYVLFYYQFPFTEDSIQQSQNFNKEVKQKQGKHKKLSTKGSPQIKDLINKLLVFKSQQRLGYTSIDQLKNHDFFKEIDWKEYYQKKIVSPLKQIIDKYPCAKNQEQNSCNYKIFRSNIPVQDKILIEIPQKSKAKQNYFLNKNLTRTRDRFSIFSEENIQQLTSSKNVSQSSDNEHFLTNK